MQTKKALLIILDGWGIGSIPEADAIAQADTPFVDHLMGTYPHAQLVTHGEEVGLPEGQMGNSEVGHLNIGAGRIVYQELVRINKAIRDKNLHKNEILQDALQYAKSNNQAVHLMGLVSDGGVHSHIDHLKALCDIVNGALIERSYIHVFTDGRDTDPKSGLQFLKELEAHIQNMPIQIASIIGRYYAMDRDKRWERIKKAYDLLVHGKGEKIADFETALQRAYQKDLTDEFLMPMVGLDDQGDILPRLQPGDVLICFNFRTDRPRQLSEALTQRNFPKYDMKKLDLRYITMTRYDETFENIEVLFEKDDISKTIGEILARAGKSQVRIAETEKYPHVTFFFSGGREAPFEHERRILIPSPKVPTYDLQPSMSANEVTEAIIKDIRQHQPDFICLNYANADMVGHTGVFEAAMEAVEVVDSCVKNLVSVAMAHDYEILIIADHGNSDYMVNEDGTPNTAHTKNPVPCIYVSKTKDQKRLRDGKLADIAPTLLSLMGLEKPKQMTGENLIINKPSTVSKH